MRQLFVALCAAALSATLAVAADDVTQTHALSLLGEPKYGPDFSHLNYVNPDAPKGGEIRQVAIGTFDSLNPFILKGNVATGLGLVYETLATSTQDDPSAEYGLIAESMQVPADNAWVGFTLRPEARFHDGSPIIADDVLFSFEILKEQGHPFFRTYYASVTGVEKLGERQLRFLFENGDNKELPMIMGQLPVLSKAHWEAREFDATTLDPWMGSGPYRVLEVDPGRSITYQRVDDYWAKDLPINRGRFNFERVKYDYYRDQTVALEAFKAGEYDLRVENSAKRWATGYDSPALNRGYIVKEEIRHSLPTGMQAFVFNTRRDFFQDPRVRQALAYAFDFEWSNKTLFFDAYTRTESYFSNSELAARGLPSEGELTILEPFREQLPEEVFTAEYHPPSTDGSGNIRGNLREARRLLNAAGWEVQDGKLVNTGTGEAMSFEMLLVSPDFERVVLPFQQNLARLGIDMSIRTVDPAQYQRRLDDFDFDMVVGSFGQSLSPGNEQRDFWSSGAADTPGSRNLIGIKDPVVDALIELIITAPDRQTLVDRTRALDRVLLWGHYVIPHFHIRDFRVAYWNKFGHPDVTPDYGLGLWTWWVDREKAEVLIEAGALTRTASIGQ